MKKKALLIMGLLLGLAMIGTVPKTVSASSSAIPMYRMYNKNSGEHFYTKNTYERDHLKKVGWRYEGIGWNAPSGGQPVYRLYNKNAGDHHYTLNKNEKDHLVKVGWRYEGIGWYSDSAKKVPLYRAYNPNAKAGTHNYTVNYNEQKNILNHGWRNEGIAWYGTTATSNPSTPTNPDNGNGGGAVTPKVKWTVWYEAIGAENASKNIKRGTKFFNSEAEATTWVDDYAINLLLNEDIASGTYGVISVLV